MSRQIFLLGAALCVVTIAFLITDGLLHPPGATEVNARRILPGMTAEQAERILGGKPEHWRPNFWPSRLIQLRPAEQPANPTLRGSADGIIQVKLEHGWEGLWYGEDGCVTVYLDSTRRVTKVWFTSQNEFLSKVRGYRAALGLPVKEPPPTIWARFRSWFGW